LEPEQLTASSHTQHMYRYLWLGVDIDALPEGPLHLVQVSATHGIRQRLDPLLLRAQVHKESEKNTRKQQRRAGGEGTRSKAQGPKDGMKGRQRKNTRLKSRIKKKEKMETTQRQGGLDEVQKGGIEGRLCSVFFFFATSSDSRMAQEESEEARKEQWAAFLGRFAAAPVPYVEEYQVP